MTTKWVRWPLWAAMVVGMAAAGTWARAADDDAPPKGYPTGSTGPRPGPAGGEGIPAPTDNTRTDTNDLTTKPAAVDRENEARRPGAKSADDTGQGLTRDVQTLFELHQINRLEIQAGKLAQSNGQSTKVKTFGALLVRDHKAFDRQLMSYARGRNITPAAIKVATPEQRAIINHAGDRAKLEQLRTVRGAEFDQQFAMMTEEGHQMTIDLVEAEQNKVKDPQFRRLLTAVIPTLQRHHEMAAQLALTPGGPQTSMPASPEGTPSTRQGRPSGTRR